MKKLSVLLAISVLFAFGYVHREVAPVKAEEKRRQIKLTPSRQVRKRGRSIKNFSKK